MQQFREIETCIDCSTSRHIQVPEVFYYAQKAVLHSTAPLDGALSDAELNDFQVKCFNAPLQPYEIIEKGRLETTWTVLRKLGYNDEIKLADDLISPFKYAPDQSVELTNEAIEFLKTTFDAYEYDADFDGVLRPRELDKLFSTAP
ncbi:hypothetical protein P8452_71365 [Trifolium repens]|nr:hypothetical protein P8452_71365 [Trifolium repens]